MGYDMPVERNYTAEIVVTFSKGGEAKDAYRALHPDDDDYITLSRKGNKIFCSARGDSPLSLLYSMDDFLSCLDLHMRVKGGHDEDS